MVQLRVLQLNLFLTRTSSITSARNLSIAGYGLLLRATACSGLLSLLRASDIRI